MAYEPRTSRIIRDKLYPSEIAAERPMLATRIHCEKHDDNSGEESIRGSLRENVVERFNRELRGGHAGRNDGDE